jgi:cation diffusion facilitator family transporter
MQKRDSTSKKAANHFKQRMTAIGFSLFIAVVLLAAKFYTYSLTRSSAVLSDALESIINVVAAGFAVMSIWMAARPPDSGHPYGHGKIEFFSAGFEGALIILAAIGIFKTGISHLLKPAALVNLEEGLAILLAATVINLLLGVMLIKIGKKLQSLTLIADGKHVLTDVYTSIGVVVGLFLVRISGWYWLDGAVACLVGLNILLTGIRLVNQSVSALMDASDPRLLDDLARLLDSHRQDVWIDIHQLRAWRSGNFVHIDLHLVLPRDFSLEDAHRKARDLERLLIDHFEGNAGVLVHMDPCEPLECPVCRQDPCERRSIDRPPAAKTWNRDHLTAKKNGP